jgi:4'-phosphopantetheinyl transferase
MSGINNINWQFFTYDDSISIAKAPFIDIYFIPVSDNIVLLGKETILSDEEIIYGNRFVKERDRAAKKISRIVTRYILSILTKIPAKDITIRRSDLNKPYCADTTEVHFNVSDSEDAIILGVSSAEIGVDIEFNNTSFEYKNMIADFFNEKEITLINQSVKPIQTFYQLWVRKEAVLKAKGTGLNQISIDETGWDIHVYQEGTYSLAFAIPEGNYAIRFFKYLANKF